MESKGFARTLALGAALLVTLGGTTGPAATASTLVGAASVNVTHSLGTTGGEVLAPGGARTFAGVSSARWIGAVNASDRNAVNAAYQRTFAAGMGVGTGWNGKHAGCVAGTTSAASRAATLNAVNFVRSINGLAPVAYNSTLNTRSQRTALMMSATKSLSHSPSRRWRCYTSDGAANAGRSNLALAYPRLTSAGLVKQYMDDAGSGNTAVGHRRWLLNPFTTAMGTGSTATANAMTVIGYTNATRPNPSYTAWPSSGQFPAPLEPAGRWSFSAGNRSTNLSSATVRVYRNGVAVKTARLRPHNGYAQPTLVFQIPRSLARSGHFTVVINKIGLGNGPKKYSRTYHITMFNPR